MGPVVFVALATACGSCGLSTARRAQPAEASVSGRVVNGITGIGTGALVWIEGESHRVATARADGFFQLAVSADSKMLIISVPGFVQHRAALELVSGDTVVFPLIPLAHDAEIPSMRRGEPDSRYPCPTPTPSALAAWRRALEPGTAGAPGPTLDHSAPALEPILDPQECAAARREVLHYLRETGLDSLLPQNAYPAGWPAPETTAARSGGMVIARVDRRPMPARPNSTPLVVLVVIDRMRSVILGHRFAVE